MGMTYSKTAETKLSMAGWEETVKQDIDEGEGSERNGVYYPSRGLTVADTAFTYAGEMEGTSKAVYLITYKDGAAPTLAFERFEGSIGGRSGSCVFRTTGTHDADSVLGTAEVVPGLGTGELASLRGEMELRLEGQPEDGYPLTLHYDLD